MSHSKSILVALALLIGVLNFTSARAQSKPNDSYIVSFNEQNPGIVSVSASITLEDTLLKMSRFGPMPDRWSDYVHDLKARNLNGEVLKVEKNDSIDWLIQGIRPSESIEISYELHVKHEDVAWPGGIDGVAFVRPWGVLLSGRSLFIMNGTDKENIEVQFKFPETWKVSVPWKSVEEESYKYVISNYTQLQESLLFAGTHEEVVIPKGNFSLKFVLGGDTILEKKQEYFDNATNVLDYYIELMGGNPIPGPNNELSTAMVILNQSEQVDGEVIGNHLSMFINPDGDMQSQVIGWFLFAHEFFHLWNGKTMRYNDTSSDWFKEGVSNYYTLKALNQTGIVNEEITKMVLNNLFYQRYVNDSGYGKLAPADAASGFDKDNHWGLIYGGGLFAGICIDMEIRKNTENGSSMDDVMRKLYMDFGGKDNLIDPNTLLANFNALGKTDFTPFLNAYIRGSNSAPLHDYLSYAGIRVNYEGGQLTLQHNSEKTKLQKQFWKGFLGEKSDNTEIGRQEE